MSAVDPLQKGSDCIRNEKALAVDGDLWFADAQETAPPSTPPPAALTHRIREAMPP
jgi:hypothetical protein